MSKDYEFELDGKKYNITLLPAGKAQSVANKIISFLLKGSQEKTLPDYDEELRPLIIKLMNGLLVNGNEVRDISKELEEIFPPPFMVYQAAIEGVKGNFPDLAVQLEGKLKEAIASIP